MTLIYDIINKLNQLFYIGKSIMGPCFALHLNFSETKRSTAVQSAFGFHHCATIIQLRKQLMDYRLLAAEEVSKHINGDH